MRKIIARLELILFHADTEPAELMAAASLALYGIALILPYDTFSIGPYGFFRGWLNETLYGSVLALIGGLGVLSVMLGSPRSRGRVTGLEFSLYIFIIITSMISNINSTTTWFYLVNALGCGWASIRLGVTQWTSTTS